MCSILIFTALPMALPLVIKAEDVNLKYTVVDGKAVITGFADTQDTIISIPSTIDSLPVSAIADNAFAGIEVLNDVTISEGIVSIGKSAFANCRNLRYITFPQSLTSIGEKAFFECTALGNVVLYQNIKTISKQSFAHCYSLETMRLSNGTTTIGEQAFDSCYNLTKIYIPKTVTTIERGALQNNFMLKICYCGDNTDWSNIIISSDNTSLADAGFSYHEYESSYLNPTCYSLGCFIYTCPICEHCYSEEDTSSELLPHDFEDDFTVDSVADDFKVGSKSRHCKNCTEVTDVTVIPRTAIAFGDYSATVEWVIKEDHTLVILGSGGISDYKLPIYTPWHEYADIITALEVYKDITKLGNNSFSSLEKLTYATINNPDTELGIYVFANISDLKIKCHKGSSAEKYAKENGLSYIYFDAPPAPLIESIVKNTATLKKTDGYEYSVDGEIWQKSNVFSIPQNEIVTFYQRIEAIGDESASPPSEASKGISVSAPQIILVGYNQISIKPCENFEYGLENAYWQADNTFTKWIIPNSTYTVYQRYIGSDDVFAVYDTNGTEVTVNGNNKPEKANAEYLVWLKKHLFDFEESHNLAADVNNDFTIDILDLVILKTAILQK